MMRRTLFLAAASTSTSSAALNTTPQLQVVTLQQVKSQSPEAIAASREAFCERKSLGALGVRVPGFEAKRNVLLRNGARLALDPCASKARESCLAREKVSPGWSGCPGNETHSIQSGFYANLKEEISMGNDGRKVVDEVFGSNIWPMEGSQGGDTSLKTSMVEAGETMHDVVLSVLALAEQTATAEARERAAFKHDNEAVGAIPNLRDLAESSSFLPSRLVYYDSAFSREDDILGGRYWLPWHVDFNMATAFIPAMWLNQEIALSQGIDSAIIGEEEGKIDPQQHPESKSGLLLRNAMGDVVPAGLQEDVILVQLGAFSQIATGGLLRAGPHAVGKPSSPDNEKNGNEEDDGLGRLSFGLFVYAPWEAAMKPPESLQCTDEDVLSDDFGGLMKKAYTGDTVLSGFQRFARYMNSS